MGPLSPINEEIVKRNSADDGLKLIVIVIESSSGAQLFVNIDVVENLEKDMVDLADRGWIVQGLQTLLGQERNISGEVQPCGAAGRVLLLDGNHLAENTRPDTGTSGTVESQVRLMGLGRDLSGLRKDGSKFPLEIGLNPVGRDGQPAVLATVMDISARKQAEEHQRLIIGELKHRTGNLLAVMQAIIANTLKQHADLARSPSATRTIDVRTAGLSCSVLAVGRRTGNRPASRR